MSESDDLDIAERVASRLRGREPVDAAFEARLLTAARVAVARGEAPWHQVEVEAGVPRRVRGSWLTASRQFSVSPLAGLAAAAVFSAIVVGVTLQVTRTGARGTPSQVASAAAGNQEVVRFVILAPSAQNVALVGDFNGWNPAATPLARGTAAGAWTVTMPLAAGTYQYAFVVDGHVWVADPAAPVALQDEFGAPSSLKVVGGRRT